MTISGVELFRTGPEQRHGLCQAEGLGPAQTDGPEGEGRCRQGHDGLFEDPQRPGLRLHAAGGDRIGHVQGFRLSVAGPGRPGPQALMEARNQLLGMARKGPEADLSPAQRHGRRARIPHRRGLGKGGRPGGSHHLHPHHASRRPSAAPMSTTSFRAAGSSGCTSRRTPPTGCCPRIWKSSMCATTREDGPVHRFCLRPLEVRPSAARAFQRVPVHEHLGGTGAGEKLRRGDEGHGRDRREASAGNRLRMDRHLLSGDGWPGPRRLFCTPFPSS